jgi:hypothetical protein
MLRLAFLSLLFISKFAFAQSPCDEFAREIDRGLREIAYFDEPAYKETAASEASRKMDRAYEVSRMQANLSLMLANRCAMPKYPMEPRIYAENAYKCRRAAPIASVAYGEFPTECDRTKWVKSGK